MNPFERDYLDLLAQQVGEEIAFLRVNNHGIRNNFPPCPFCYESRGKWNCRRIDELKQFQSSIAVKRNTPRNPDRVSIGKMIDDETPLTNSSTMELLPITL